MNTLVKLVMVVALVFFGTTEVTAQWWGKRVTGNGNVTTETVKTGDYDEIKVAGFMDVHLERGTEGTITVTTDSNLHEYIVIETEGDNLIIKTRKNANIRTKKGVHVTVPFQDLSRVSLSGSGDIDTKDRITADDFKLGLTGSGDIDLSLDVASLDSYVTGSGDISLSGNAKYMEVSVTGSGDVKAASLTATDVDARVSGSGDIKLNVTGSLKARVSGSGDIRYTGSPSKSDTKVSGSGSIKPM